MIHLIEDQVITDLTGCRREDLRKEIITKGSMPGKILARSGNEYLCVEEQSYHDGLTATGNPEDYVLVVIPQG